MAAAGPFRWFLALLAMALPVTARSGGTRSEATVRPTGGDHVVFRHYL